jgi:pyridinium-3,5-biscarboxylic acid mononucleotide sulfurtransferase
MQLEAKAERLKSLLRSCGRVAIAFSGGVDSSLLLTCALEALGSGNVLVLFAQSELLTQEEISLATNWLVENGYPQGVEMEVIQLRPLAWKDFVRNGEDRCYLCKHRIYSTFRNRMETRGLSCLIDGTNTDDFKGHRAGLRAIRELGVMMPLVEAGFDKTDVRNLSQQLGLTTWDRPSASCLATRIPVGMEITSQRLRQIEVFEKGLGRLGLAGCRVRLSNSRQDVVCLEISAKDFEIVIDSGIRKEIQRFFHNYGVNKVLLDLEGRV